jgi:hypothetical protein
VIDLNATSRLAPTYAQEKQAMRTATVRQLAPAGRDRQ